MARTSTFELEVQGRKVQVSNLEKVFYPSGFTKGQVLEYYSRVAPVMLPHLRDRPLTLKRYPDGTTGPFFYQKECPPYRPKWLQTASVWSDERDAKMDYCLANDLASLLWLVNAADLEFHTLLARADDVERPTMVAFDLDPGAPADVRDCARVALLLRDACRAEGLETYPKTSGSKGLQVYLPLNRSEYTYADTKPFAHRIAQSLEAERPREITSNMRKNLRTGKVLVDWGQNDRHKTTVCVYSLRAKEHPTVSTPMKWAEVEHAAAENEVLSFVADEVVVRTRKHGDLFAPVLERRQRLPTAERTSTVA